MKPLKRPKPDDNACDVILENRKHIVRLEQRVKRMEKREKEEIKGMMLKEIPPILFFYFLGMLTRKLIGIE